MTRIVAIGNGQQALEWEAGEKIDSFDIVIRINRFQLTGFEAHVGTKTDIWCVNCQPNVQNKIKERKKRGWDFSQLQKFILIPSKAQWKTDKAVQVISEMVPEVPIDVVPYEIPLSITSKNGYWSTTGTNLLVFLAKQGVTVYTHGFNLLTDKIRGHYFDEPGGGIHRPNGERAVIQPFMNIKLLQVLCPSS